MVIITTKNTTTIFFCKITICFQPRETSQSNYQIIKYYTSLVLSPLSGFSVVHEVKCLNCSAVYVGESNQYVHKRIYEHLYSMYKQKPAHSSPCQHAIQMNSILIIQKFYINTNTAHNVLFQNHFSFPLIITVNFKPDIILAKLICFSIYSFSFGSKKLFCWQKSLLFCI